MKKEYIYNTPDSLQKVVNLINDASFALNDKKRTIKESLIPPSVFVVLVLELVVRQVIWHYMDLEQSD